MKRIKRISLFLAVITLISCAGFQGRASAATVGGSSITAAGAIVLDFETGRVLFEYNADVYRPPASMTKLMTVYLVYEAIAQGKIALDTVVPISQNAYDFSRQSGETNVPLYRNLTYTVDELLDVVLVMSAGGAAVALAELVGRSTSAFYRIMNAKAAEWGIDAVFYSASGGSTHTRMTPRAMAVLTRNTVRDFPEILKKTSMTSVTHRGRTYPSTDLLLGVYPGLDGMKTGTNSVARECFAGTAKRGDVRIVSVVMGSSSGKRFSDTTTLLNYGFAEMEAIKNAETESRKVSQISSRVLVDGVEIEFEAYLIEDRNYFRIRDIAYVLKGTPAQFNVYWEEETGSIVFVKGADYDILGTEMAGRSEEMKLPVASTAAILIDGEEVVFPVFAIDGNNFFRLRDVADTFGFRVEWDEENQTIIIDTGADPLQEEEQQQ